MDLADLAETHQGQNWGIDPGRRNRHSVRFLLWLIKVPPTRFRVVNRLVRLMRRSIELVVGSDFRALTFGSQLFVPHPHGVVVNAGVVIGERCTIFQNVTLGETTTRPGLPVLGNDVVVGAGAAVLGAVTIGDGVRVGANAVVLDDVPAGATVVGAPARLVNRRANGLPRHD